MFRSRFTNFTHAGSGFPGGAARRSLTQAASLAAITVLMLGTLSGPAVAQASANANTKPLRVSFVKLQCLQQSNDNTWPNPDHDEPYVVIFVADLRGGAANGKVFSSIFRDVDAGEASSATLQFWALDGNGAPIGSDDDYIMLAAMLESDGWGNLSAIYNRLANTLIPRLVSYKASGMSRSAIAGALSADMDLAIEAARDDHDDEDDRIGGIFEMLWGQNGLEAARAGNAVDLLPVFEGSGMRYQLTFRLQ
jgi:hypothetical protein